LDIVIISIRRADGEMLFNPAADTIIDAGDILIAIGQIEALTRLNEMAR
jgi:voltage-gated potassium channel